MMANAAFHVGLTIGMSHRVDALLPAFPFRYADYNFYRSAQSSLDAELLWPSLKETSPREIGASDLCRVMLPVADEGLAEIGVDEFERDRLLGIVTDRLDTGITPARWQRETLHDMGDIPRDIAMRHLVEVYLDRINDCRPVTEW
jgi:hypothetical protein